jgi:spore germination cell wall hydrolase CwlJ-like protein
MKWILPIALLLGCINAGASGSARALELLNCDDHMDDDYIALACNMYWEANTQGVEGMLAVAAVTLERQQHPSYPNTVAGVVWEQRKIGGKFRPQFSWTRDGKRDAPTVFGRKVWERALNMARMFSVPRELRDEMCPQVIATERMWDILEAQGVPVKRREVVCEVYDNVMRSKAGILKEMTAVSGALFYHATYVEPYWSDRLVKAGWNTLQVGDHIFYSKEEFID